MQEEPWHVQRRRELEAAAPVKRKAKKWQHCFVSVPWVWADQLKTCDRAATFKLALLLLYEHWRSNGSRVRLTNALAATMDILPEAKRRALADLERRGLVSVERRSRKTPLVTILHAD
jgi:hypothetical protein